MVKYKKNNKNFNRWDLKKNHILPESFSLNDFNDNNFTNSPILSYSPNSDSNSLFISQNNKSRLNILGKDDIFLDNKSNAKSIIYTNDISKHKSLTSSKSINFNVKSNSYNNKASKLKKKTFICHICMKNFTRKEHLQKHNYHKHSGYTGTICNICGKTIKRIKDHINYCKLKNNILKKRITNNKKNNIFKSKIFGETLNIPNFALDYENKEIISEIYLNVKNCKSINFEDFKLYINNKIGEGGNMDVFYGKDNKTGEDLAVKVDKEIKKNSDIYNEAIILTVLKGIPGIPKFYYYEYYNEKNIIAESLLGINFHNIINLPYFKLDWILISIIGINLIHILEKIHSRGIIHNDIKPANLCWGRFNKGNLIDLELFFLIDFGYAIKYDIPNTSTKKSKYKNNLEFPLDNIINNKFQGTAKFMAIDKSKGLIPNRKTDLEELLYTLLYMIQKGLPWEKIKSKTHKEECIKMRYLKEQLLATNYFDNIFPEIKYIFKCIRNIGFKEEPDYQLYIILFESILRKFKIENEDLKNNYISLKISELFKAIKSDKKSKSKNTYLKSLFKGYPIN